MTEMQHEILGEFPLVSDDNVKELLGANIDIPRKVTPSINESP